MSPNCKLSFKKFFIAKITRRCGGLNPLDYYIIVKAISQPGDVETTPFIINRGILIISSGL
jgi:hypothetical protein